MSAVGNFISRTVFGQSNQGNNPNPGPGYQTGKQQIEQPQNNNSQIQSGNTGAADATGGEQIDPNKKPEGSQLDTFNDLFKMETDDKGQPIVRSDPMDGPIMNLDAAKLQEAAKKMNFTQGMDPEILQKAMSGSDPAAFMQVLNTAVQNGFQGAIKVTQQMAEEAIQRNNARVEAALPDRIRTTQIRQHQSSNPVLSHPAVAPIMEGLKATIAQKNPNLSPDRVAGMAEQYFMAMHGELNNVSQANDKQQRDKQNNSPDWENLLLT